MKTCTKCSQQLNLKEFYKDSKSNDGFKAKCKSCECAQGRARSQEKAKLKESLRQLEKMRKNTNPEEERRRSAAEWMWAN